MWSGATGARVNGASRPSFEFDVHLNQVACVVWQATIAKWASANFHGAQ